MTHLNRRRSTSDSRPGQSLVEFSLLLPVLLVILLGVADFGRVVQAGIVMESAAGAAAEAGAVEYLREVVREDPTFTPDYGQIREVAAQVACREANRLANSEPDCPDWPIIRVCVHDDAAGDPDCGGAGSVGAAAIPDGCPMLEEAWSAASNLPVAATDANPDPRGAYVEVRTCYRFTTILPVNEFLPIGEVFLQRQSTFTVADY